MRLSLQRGVGLDLERYRQRAERFVEELHREHYLHYAGHRPELQVEEIYDSYAELFAREAVEALREGYERATPADGDAARRARYLLEFAFAGHLGRETRHEEAELARREAALEVGVAGGSVPYRMVPVEQANEADGERREALERTRNALLETRLNPLHLERLERAHSLVRELGWASYRDACAELSGIDLERLAGQVAEFARVTEDAYPRIADPELRRAALAPLGRLRRSDLPRFFRAPGLDSLFPEEELIGSFGRTLAGLGIDPDRQPNVHLDTELRPTKSPRAFCATPKVPDEVYLVIAPVGGRDDFGALFHEGGHAEHYAHVDRELAFEFRHLGDNSVTESFAFLLEHLTADSAWLEGVLGIADPEPIVSHFRAWNLFMLRRYAAKIAYELELHGPDTGLVRMPDRYAEVLGTRTQVDWPRESWLADVDPGFYVACYLRAWALETRWRLALRERFGERWFERSEAGEWLRGLWRQGQRLAGDELLAEVLGEELDFAVMAEEVVPT